MKNLLSLVVIGWFAAAAAQTPETTIRVDATHALHRVSRYLTGACIEDVNHEEYGGIYSQMIFGESFQEPPPTNNSPAAQPGVSRQWRGFLSGSAHGEFALATNAPFVGAQSQRVTFAAGEGAVGIENKGLNRWGMNFVADRSYEGVIWARAQKPASIFVCLETGDGQAVLAEQQLEVTNPSWERLNFNLTPTAADARGRLAIKLKQPGTVDAGYAFLQPGDWGRFRGLPDRRDVAEGLIDQGITVLRCGGSMVNSPNYRWKKMIGPRERRPPYHGTWYRYSTDGWGILDFLDFCEAAGFLPVPDFNMDESPQDMADFVEYVNGAPDSPWGRKRVEAGHAASYHLTHLELGNEERVDEGYWNKFKPLAEAIWAKDPALIPVVGDFAYGERIADPLHVKGAASGIKSLAAHQEILRLAKSQGREVWFDVHVGTDGPRPDHSLAGALAFVDTLEALADGARFHVVIFEFNAGNPSHRRALANALAINAVERDGRIPVATSANCLQPDGQNDNGWNQGLLFLNPSQVWQQPPGYVTQMVSRNYEPLELKCDVQSAGGDVDVSAKCSEDKTVLTLQVVNSGSNAAPASIRLEGFVPSKPVANVTELAGPLKAFNTADAPARIKPQQREWRHELKDGAAFYTFPADSFTVLRFER